MSDELSGFRFVSADSHVNEPPELFRERMPKALQERAPRVDEVDGVPHLLVEGLRPRRLPKGREQLSDEEVDRAQAGGWDPELRLRDQERDGVAAEVVFPTLSLQSAFSSPDPVLQLALARAYNDWVAEVFGDYPQRFAPAGLVPMLDIAAAEAEARHCIDLGLRSLFLPIQVPERPYNDPAYDRFWAFAEETGVPLTFHSGTGHEPRVVRGPGGAIINYLLGAQADGAHLVMHLTASGVLDRFPELTVVTVETGAAWLAWVTTQMDEIADKHHMWAKPKLSMRPSDFVRRQVHVTFQNDPVGVHNRVFTGVDSLLWGSDYPHPEGTWPNSQRICAEQLSGLPDTEKRAILGGTTSRIFGFAQENATS